MDILSYFGHFVKSFLRKNKCKNRKNDEEKACIRIKNMI